MFWTRLASGIVLLALAIGMISLGGIPLALLLWITSLIAFRELTRALKCGGTALEVLGMAGIISY